MIKELWKPFSNNTLLEKNWKKLIFSLYLFLLLFLIFKGTPVLSWGPGPNYVNYSVKSTVNVTNAYPEILNITCNNRAPITLTAGSTRTVICLVQMRDFGGGSTILTVNGTYYYILNQSSDPDDNNTHYSNNSCLVNSTNGYYANWTCGFDLWYYAVNGTWIANITATDEYSSSTTSSGNNSNVTALFALNVTDVIDFGNLQVTQTSSSIQANVTNLGNVPINVSVYGFGGNDSVTGAGLAMRCDQRNITLPNERYDLNDTTIYDLMTPLTGSLTMISGLKISKQTQPDVYSLNSTYWRLHVNLTTNPFGICNGTVVFAARSS